MKPAGVEISWPLDGTTVYGSLLTPSGPGPFPGVVMVAGSGPTDRDWNSPLIPGSNGSARLIAEALAAAGIASLRYDKRAAGPHARENLPALIGKISFQSHLDEVAGAVSALASRADSDPARIFALTSSEGTLHALNYQVHDPALPFAGMVLTGAPGRAMGAVGRSQVVAELSAPPRRHRRWLPPTTRRSTDSWRARRSSRTHPCPRWSRRSFRRCRSPANLPFARELWVTDPTTWIAQVRVPMLVVIGQKRPPGRLAGGRRAAPTCHEGKRGCDLPLPREREPRPEIRTEAAGGSPPAAGDGRLQLPGCPPGPGSLGSHPRVDGDPCLAERTSAAAHPNSGPSRPRAGRRRRRTARTRPPRPGRRTQHLLDLALAAHGQQPRLEEHLDVGALDLGRQIVGQTEDVRAR